MPAPDHGFPPFVLAVPDCPCPGHDPAAGTLFRVVRTNPPTPEDFRSLFELGRKCHSTDPELVCMHRGLSVCRTERDARATIDRFPRAGRYIAQGEVGPDQGVTKPTPADDRPSHTTWWPFRGLDFLAMFRVPSDE